MIFSRRLRVLIICLTLALLLCGWIFYKMQVPKPQISSAVGQPAPDFSLTDQSDQMFRLADQRGHRVLLIFYRGYW